MPPLAAIANLLLHARLKPGEAAGFSGFYFSAPFAQEVIHLRDYTPTTPPASGSKFTYAIAFAFGFAFTLALKAAKDGLETLMQ